MSKNMDDKIEKLNAKIARLLGKKGNNKPNLGLPDNDEDTIGSVLYLVVTIFCVILLWLVTGVYYVGDKYFGIIVNNGKTQEVVTGPKLGFTMPTPFGSVIVIDAVPTDMKDFTIDGSNDINYKDLALDNIEVNALAQFSYQIVEPIKLYNKVKIEKSNIENIVRLGLADSFHKYIETESSTYLATANLTIIGNQVRDNVNKYLANYGVTVVKFNVSKLNLVSNKTFDSKLTEIIVSTQNQESFIATQLIKQANSYKEDMLAKTRASISKYNTLLVQYKKTPQIVAEQMYYDALAQVGITQADNYNLLFMSLPQLLELVKNSQPPSKIKNLTDLDGREFSRNVLRERNFGQ